MPSTLRRLAPLFFLCVSLIQGRPVEFVIFGDEASERRLAVSTSDARVGPGTRGERARYIGVGGEIRFTVPLKAGEPNLVTFQYSGDDVAGAEIEAEGGRIQLGAPSLDVMVGGRELVADTNDYERLDSGPALPGRFFYRTYLLPEDLGKGRSSLELRLIPSPTTGGTYARAGGGAAQTVPKGIYSRGVYRVFVHNENFVPPPSDELAPPAAPATPVAEPDVELLRRRIVTKVDEAVAVMLERQLFGPEFERAADAAGVPPAPRGLFSRPDWRAYLDRGRKEGAKADWLTPVTGSGNGRSQAGNSLLFLWAYRNPLSKYHGNPEMVERAIAAMDGHRRYQGSNGAYEIGGGQNGWLGGPNRKPSSGGLQGFFVGDIARSFQALWPEVKDRPEILDARIDSDGDGATDTTRREAWATIFRDWLGGQMGLRGGVANQAQANAIGAALAARSLLLLDPAAKIDEADIQLLGRQAVGLAPHPRGNWMLTQAGIASEGGGFCPAYGQHPMENFPSLIEIGFDPAMEDRFRQYLRAFEHMVYLRDGLAGGPVLVEGPVGSRFHLFPGKELEGGSVYAARRLGDAYSGWAVAQQLRRTDHYENLDLGDLNGVHLTSRVKGLALLADELDQVKEIVRRPEVLAYVPHALRDGPTIFSDPECALVAIHFGAGRSLFFQRGRYHYIEPGTQAFGEVAMREEDGLRAIRHGRWYVVQNISDTERVSDDGGRTGVLRRVPREDARDLVSGEMIAGGRPLEVPARALLVLEIGDGELVDLP